MRLILYFFAVVYVANAFWIFFFPHHFYESIPGLSLMGPFSMHFIRDVGLTFLATGVAIGWGAWKLNRPVAIAGASWHALHGLFHLQIWFKRGIPFDFIAFVDFMLVIIPSAVVILAAVRLKSAE